MHRQGSQGAAELRDVTGLINSTQASENAVCSLRVVGRWGVEKLESLHPRRAPRGGVEERLGQVGDLDFRRGPGGKGRELRPRDATHHNARTLTSRTACALVRGGLCTRAGDQAGEATRDVESRSAREAGVDNGAHTRNGHG